MPNNKQQLLFKHVKAGKWVMSKTIFTKKMPDK